MSAYWETTLFLQQIEPLASEHTALLVSGSLYQWRLELPAAERATGFLVLLIIQLLYNKPEMICAQIQSFPRNQKSSFAMVQR